jgi:hypothetical protein
VRMSAVAMDRLYFCRKAWHVENDDENAARGEQQIQIPVPRACPRKPLILFVVSRVGIESEKRGRRPKLEHLKPTRLKQLSQRESW